MVLKHLIQLQKGGGTGELVTVSAEVQGEEYSATVISGALYTSKIICNKSGTITADINIAATATLILNDTCTSFSFSPNYALFYDSVTSAYYYPVEGANTVTASGQTISLSATSKNISVSNNLIVALYANVTSTSVFLKVSTSPSFTFTIGTTAAASSIVSADATAIAPMVGAGDEFSCGLVYPGGSITAGNVYCWGKNSGKVISELTTTRYRNPRMVINSTTLGGTSPVLPNSTSGTVNSPVALYVGDELFCVLDSSKSVWCDGYWMTSSSSGIGSSDGYIYKIPISGYTGTIINVAIGDNAACALTNTSQVWCWGSLGFATYSTPTQITSFTSGATIKKLAVGEDFICAILGTDFHVECLGNNTKGSAYPYYSYVYGQLGNNTTTSTYPGTQAPKVLTAVATPLTNVVDISARSFTVCAINISNQSYCWGNVNGTVSTMAWSAGIWYNFNMLGNIADYSLYSNSYVSTELARKPVKQDGTTNYSLTTVNVGGAAVCGVSSGASTQYLCWGVDLTNPNGRAYYIYSGYLYDYSYSGSTLYGYYFNSVYGTNTDWNNYYQSTSMGTSTAGGTYTFTSSIYSIAVGSDYNANSTTYGQVCAALLDGSIRCWGGNHSGQVGNGKSGLDNGASYDFVTTPYMVLAPTGTALPSGQAASKFY